MRLRILGCAAALVVGASTLTGCGAAGGSTLGTGDDFTVEGALGALPDVSEKDDGGSEELHVVVGDLGAVRGSTESAEDEDYAEWRRPVERSGIGPTLPDNLRTEYLGSDEVRRTLGFDARDVLAYASLEDPPSSLTVVSLADGAGLKDETKATGPGEPGDRAELSGAVPPAFPVVLGLAQRAGQVALGQSADVLVDWADRGDTLADEDELGAVAKALDSKRVVAAELVDGEVRPVRASASQRAQADLVPGYDAVGVGQQLGDGGRVTTWIAYATDEPDRLASAVRRQWREGVSLVGGVPLSDLARLDGVSAEDDTVLVELTPARPDVVLQMLQRGDAPFLVTASAD